MPILENPRHERFAQLLAEGKTADEAYEGAGYKPNAGNACRLKGNDKVSERVGEILGKAAANVGVTVERVLSELALLGFANMQDYMKAGPDGDPYLDFSGLTREQAAALVEVTVEDFKDGRGEDARDVRRVKFKLADKKAALVDIGKHLGMFKERVELGGPDGEPVRVEMLIVDPRHKG
jgi:phage terminase small subunit